MPLRRRTNAVEALVHDLKTSVDFLIKENRTLKREVHKLTERGITLTRGRPADSIAIGLSRMKRRLELVLDRPSSARTSKTVRVSRTRKPASAETTAKRLEALAKARAARAAKRAATS